TRRRRLSYSSFCSSVSTPAGKGPTGPVLVAMGTTLFDGAGGTAGHPDGPVEAARMGDLGRPGRGQARPGDRPVGDRQLVTPAPGPANATNAQVSPGRRPPCP